MEESEEQGFKPAYTFTEKVHNRLLESWAELTVYLYKCTKVRLCGQPMSGLHGHPCIFTDLTVLQTACSLYFSQSLSSNMHFQA